MKKELLKLVDLIGDILDLDSFNDETNIEPWIEDSIERCNVELTDVFNSLDNTETQNPDYYEED